MTEAVIVPFWVHPEPLMAERLMEISVGSVIIMVVEVEQPLLSVTVKEWVPAKTGNVPVPA